MVPPLSEIVQSLAGSLRLARLDPDGLDYFNQSVEGFWRSFFAIVLIAPLFYLLLALETPSDGKATSAATLTVGLLAGWIAYPLAMVFIAKLLGLSHRYVVYIIAYNWCAVPAAAIRAPVLIAVATGLIGASVAGFFYMFLLVAVIYYLWFVARTALQTTSVTAATLVVFDIALSFVVELGVERLLGG